MCFIKVHVTSPERYSFAFEIVCRTQHNNNNNIIADRPQTSISMTGWVSQSIFETIIESRLENMMYLSYPLVGWYRRKVSYETFITIF